jgi:AraC-like DNA-binding protein
MSKAEDWSVSSCGPGGRSPMEGSIWIVSNDRRLLKWASQVFGKYDFIPIAGRSDFPLYPLPQLIILECNYRCCLDTCARNFELAVRFPKVPAILARPSLAEDTGTDTDAFLSSRLYYAVEIEQKGKAGDSEQVEYQNSQAAYLRGLYATSSLGSLIQKEIIDSQGKVNRISELATKYDRSASWLSRRFREACGVPLKSFANKIRLCHCLWELISTTKAVKLLAFEYGYRSSFFSRKFHTIFSKWPSEARRGGE